MLAFAAFWGNALARGDPIVVNALELRTALSLAFVYVLRMLGLFMVMPVLAVEAQQFEDYAPYMVGIAIGGYGLTQALLQIPMGMLSDRWGRKPVILLGLLVFSAGSFVASAADSLLMLSVGRILQGAGAIAGAIMALATDVTRETQRAKVLAIIGVSIGFSFYLAVLLGPVLANAAGISGIFLLTACLALLSMPLVYWGVPSVSAYGHSEVLPQAGQWKRLIFSSQLWRLNVSVLLLHFSITLLFVKLPLLLQEAGVALHQQLTLYLPVLGLSIVGLVILMGLSRRNGVWPMLLISVSLIGAAFVGIASSSSSLFWLGAFVVVYFAGFNFLEANLPALLSSIAPAGDKGTAMGLFASCQFFGAFLGGIFAGGLASLASTSTVYWLGAAVTLPWMYVVFGIRSTDKYLRFTLPIDAAPDAQIKQWQANLNQLPGMVEVALSADKQTFFLKTQAEFNIELARGALRAE